MACGDERNVFLGGGKHRIDIKTLSERKQSRFGFCSLLPMDESEFHPRHPLDENS